MRFSILSTGLLAGLFFVFFVFGARAEAPSPTTHSVTILVEGLEGGPSSLRAALYLPADDFPMGDTPTYAISRSVASSSGSLVFPAVRPGRYAVVVHHDQNGDGELNMNFLGIPKEALGFGNGAPLRTFGAPTFESASILVSGETKTQVPMRY